MRPLILILVVILAAGCQTTGEKKVVKTTLGEGWRILPFSRQDFAPGTVFSSAPGVEISREFSVGLPINAGPAGVCAVTYTNIDSGFFSALFSYFRVPIGGTLDSSNSAVSTVRLQVYGATNETCSNSLALTAQAASQLSKYDLRNYRDHRFYVVLETIKGTGLEFQVGDASSLLIDSSASVTNTATAKMGHSGRSGLTKAYTNMFSQPLRVFYLPRRLKSSVSSANGAYKLELVPLEPGELETIKNETLSILHPVTE